MSSYHILVVLLRVYMVYSCPQGGKLQIWHGLIQKFQSMVFKQQMQAIYVTEDMLGFRCFSSNRQNRLDDIWCQDSCGSTMKEEGKIQYF